MTLTRFQKFTLGIAGVTALGIGASILVAPHIFYASYGISFGNDVNLSSELRASAAGLAAFGVLMLAGIVRSAFSQVSVLAALTVFLAFPAGRLVGVLVDGVPSGSILAALAVELAIAALCLIAFRTGRSPANGAADSRSPMAAWRLKGGGRGGPADIG